MTKLGLSTMLSFWKIFRLIFVFLFLYLLGDVFYRWDGFSYYASFSEYLPSVALISTLWCIVAVFLSALVLILFSAVEWLCLRAGLKIKREHFIVFSATLSMLGLTVWITKDLVHYGRYLPVPLFIVLISTLIAWLCRNKAERLVEWYHDHITPLVFLFGIWVIFSVPLVIYQTWIKASDPVATQNINPSVASDINRPNIILVTFDAMTTRDMSVYGYHRNTTPFISEWAKTASVFTRHHAASNYTRSTIASLITGKRVWTHQVYHSDQRGWPAKIRTENLSLLLKKNGYYNIDIAATLEASMGVINDHSNIVVPLSELHKPLVLDELIEDWLFRLFAERFKLFDWFVKEDFILDPVLNDIALDSSIIGRRPNLAFNKFLEILDNDVSRPYFARIHLYPPHFPYLPLKPYMGMFDSSSELRTLKSQRELRKSLKGKGENSDTDRRRSRIKVMRARYDEHIRYCDSQFKEFMKRLEAKNRLKNTVIIFTADHGESFEHDYFTHGGPFLYEQVTHIPLIIKEPEQEKGRIVNDLVEQIDVPATILDLAKIDVPSWMEGRSIVPLLRGEKRTLKPIYSVNFETNRGFGHKITKGIIAVWMGDYKLIYDLDTEDSLLFNLKQDPDELNNLVDTETAQRAYLLSLVQDALNDANEKLRKEK